MGFTRMQDKIQRSGDTQRVSASATLVQYLPVTALNRAPFEPGAKADPVPGVQEGKWGDAVEKGTPPPRGPQPPGESSRGQQPCLHPMTPHQPHHPYFGVKKQAMRMFLPEPCLWLLLSNTPSSLPGELFFCLPSPKMAVLSSDAHATPLNVLGTEGEHFSQGFQRDPGPPCPGVAGVELEPWLVPGVEQPRSSRGSPDI